MTAPAIAASAEPVDRKAAARIVAATTPDHA
jgi:hypothetical protein